MPEPNTILLLGGGLAGIGLRLVRQQYRILKRTADILFATVALILSSPIIAIFGVLIKLTSRGPVFFCQERVGRNGRIFKIIKLRTMRVDAEAQTGPVWARQNDPRVTPVGGFLRCVHLDELPQLINVLKGDMSMVGPRPERPVFVNQFVQQLPEYAKRHNVRPGITGLAQVRCPADQTLADVRRKLRLDLLYIRRMCWLVDFRIMAGTLRTLLGGNHRPRRVAAAT